MRALLEDPKRFDLTTQTERQAAPGVRVLSAKYADSLTVAPFAYDFDGTEAEATAWMAASKIPVLRFEEAAQPATVEMEMEVLYAGTFRPASGAGASGEWKVTDADLAEIASTTNRVIDSGWLRPPIKLGHDDDQERVRALFPEGGDPALGWIKSMEVRAGRLVAKCCDVPRRLAAAVKEGRWKPGSIEVAKQWTDPTGGKHEKACLAFALLGAMRPAAGGLQTIGLSAPCDGVVVLMLAHTPEDTTGHPSPASGEDAQHADPAVAVTPQQEPSPEEKRNMETVEELKAALAAEQAARKADHEARLAERLDGLVAARKLTPGELTKQKTMLAGMSPEVQVLHLAELDARTPSADLTQPVARVDSNAAAPSNKKGEARLIELAEQIAKDKGIPYPQALCLAADSEPETYQAYYATAHPLRSGELKGGN